MRAIVAVDPISLKGAAFQHFCRAVQFFQSHGLFPEISLAAISHSALYMVPNSYYYENRRRFSAEAKEEIEDRCRRQFEISSIHVINSNSARNEDHVRQMSRYSKRKNGDMLIVSSNNRVGLPYWFLGSFSETAALTASVPILILKPQTSVDEFHKDPLFVLCIDVSAPPSKKAINWIAKKLNVSGSEFHLLYVAPKERSFFKKLRPRLETVEAKKVLSEIHSSLKSLGAKSEQVILDEKDSIAHTVADYADRCEAWLTIVTAPDSPMKRRLLLGSTSRQILRLTKRPFLSLRVR